MARLFTIHVTITKQNNKLNYFIDLVKTFGFIDHIKNTISVRIHKYVYIINCIEYVVD